MSDRSPHVLILPSWYPTRHSPEEGCFFREQALALRRIGLQVGVAYPDLRSLRTTRRGGLLDNRLQISLQDDCGVPTLRWHGWNPPNSPRLRRTVWLAQAAKLIERYGDRFGRPDLIHAHSASWAGAAALAALRRFGVPYVITEHSSYYARGLIHPWQEPHIRDVFRSAAATLAVSGAIREDIASLANGATVQVVPNGVDTDFFVPPPGARSTAPFRFLTVGILDSNKAVDVLLRAFAALAPQGLGPILEIGGKGPERDDLQKLARRLGIDDRVRFLGQLSREQVRRAMQRANAFVLPSRVETFGVVLIEAMATGLPVIASRAGGPQEIVRPEVGLLTKPGDVADLTRALAELRDGYADWAARSGEIRAYAVAAFAQEAVAQRLNRIYRQVLGWGAEPALTPRVRKCAS